MRSHKGTRVLIVLSLAAVAFMAAAGAADAKKHHKRKHRLGPLLVLAAGATTSGNGGIATQTATCPRKTRATGKAAPISECPKAIFRLSPISLSRS